MLQQGPEMYIYFCSRHAKLHDCFSVHDSVCECSNINDLFQGVGSEHNPE